MSDLVEGPAHLTSKDGRVLVWFIEPLGMVDVHLGGHFTEEQGHFLSSEANAVMLKRAADGQKAVFIHDWSKVSSYDAVCRRRLIEWGLSWGRARIERIFVCLGKETPTIMRMACATGALAMNLAGIRIEVTDDLGAPRRHHPMTRRIP